ncbi:hypothetical protein O3G_MSEX012333 [Manduca sexta]|uniref:Pseudouridine synthase RsuA/RluA-like domain-containing protein n=1 Tax=Manduca sexta TaxID=7130 RepID=A0A921ZNL8_MANSE|nr:hypothetical protein O3G_MSEX012333 [Manduca sexta]
MEVKKLYESGDYLIVNKPYDMYINSDDENEKNTVTYHIASPDSHLSTSFQPLHFVQRLDYATSGVLCIAKNKSAAGRAGKLFEKRLTKKYYLAVVRGHVELDLADIEYDVGMDPSTADSSHRMVAVTPSSEACVLPRAAHTRLLLLETGYYGSDAVSVVLLKPITGRRHQLRVHCSALRHTILGDYTYSGAADVAPHRMFLHATRFYWQLYYVSDDVHPEPVPLCPAPRAPPFPPSFHIKTPEPFFSDQKFASQWKSEQVVCKYKSEAEFMAACDVIDRSYVIGVRYKLFSCRE